MVVNAKGVAVEIEKFARIGTFPHYRSKLQPGEALGPSTSALALAKRALVNRPVNQTAPKQVRAREFADPNRTTVLNSAAIALSLQEPRAHSFTEPSRKSLCGLRIYAKRRERELSAFLVNQMATVFAPAE